MDRFEEVNKLLFFSTLMVQKDDNIYKQVLELRTGIYNENNVSCARNENSSLIFLLHPSLLKYCRTHNVSVCLYIAYIACGSASLYIKTLYFFPTVRALSAAATVANIKIRYDAKTPQFAIFGTRVICVFYSI